MRVSGLIAGVCLLGVVPIGIILVYYGYRSGLYPYFALPIVLGAYLLVVLSALFFVLPRLRRLERSKL